MKWRRAIGALVLAFAALVFALPATAGATVYAPINRPGPALSVPAAKLAAALKCDGPLTGVAHPPVLLVPGTTLNLRDPHDARRLWRTDRHHRPLTGRNGAPVGAALLA